ncbi:hypothetical protein ES703_118126 [subsurface metagenome]
MIRRGLPICEILSRRGKRSFIPDILPSFIRINVSSSSHIISSWSVIKYGDTYPLSNCIPSTTSSSVFSPLPSSAVITPSLPAFSIASAIILPISLSLFEEIVATCSISLLSFNSRDIFSNSTTTLSTAFSIPLFRAIGLTPAATFFIPSCKIASARTVAVVVPSPATSLVCDATSFTI